jgi:tRNA (guanine-N7-)-methyltransferase
VYNYNIENVFFLRGDIFFFIDFFDDNMFNNVYINFSDPWPKKRHIKRRVINQKFLDKIYLKLKNNGKLYFVTDDKNYLNYSVEQFKMFNRFKPCFENYYVNNIEGYPESLYCKLFKEKGKVINYTCYLKE